MSLRDIAFMQFSSDFFNLGTHTQINIKPSVFEMTNYAIESFSPEERGCYVKGEANLTYFPYHLGYRYVVNNCLINEGKLFQTYQLS